jgi:hypothetical protein
MGYQTSPTCSEILAHLIPRLRIRTKDELALKSDNAATVAVGRYLRGQKSGWTDCDIGYAGFLRRDPHSNRKGHLRLAKCISKIIGDR